MCPPVWHGLGPAGFGGSHCWWERDLALSGGLFLLLGGSVLGGEAGVPPGSASHPVPVAGTRLEGIPKSWCPAASGTALVHPGWSLHPWGSPVGAGLAPSGHP